MNKTGLFIIAAGFTSLTFVLLMARHDYELDKRVKKLDEAQKELQTGLYSFRTKLYNEGEFMNAFYTSKGFIIEQEQLECVQEGGEWREYYSYTIDSSFNDKAKDGKGCYKTCKHPIGFVGLNDELCELLMSTGTITIGTRKGIK